MIDKLFEEIPEEHRSAPVYQMVLGYAELLYPTLLLLFDKQYSFRTDSIECGLDLKVGNKQKLEYARDSLVPVQKVLEQRFMQGVFLPRLLGTLDQFIDAVNSDISLMNSLEDLFPDREMIYSFIERFHQMILSKTVSLDPELKRSWDELESLLLESVKLPVPDLIRNKQKAQPPESLTSLGKVFYTLLLVPIYEHKYFLFLKQKIQDLEEEEKTGIEVLETKVKEDRIDLPRAVGPNIESSLIDGLAKILMPYFTEETDEINLKALLKREEVKERLFFNGPGNRFVEVFRQLHEKRKIYSSKKITSHWICQYFCFLNANTKEVTDFKAETVYDILSRRDNPVSRKKRIDISQLFDQIENKK